MLLVKTVIGPSRIAGTGLFAMETIKAGTNIWRFSHIIDRRLTREEVENLSEPERSKILGLHFAYISKQTALYIIPGDDAQYINHSSSPNIGTRFEENVEEDVNYALKDLQPGEEFTIDYNSFAQEGTNFELI